MLINNIDSVKQNYSLIKIIHCTKKTFSHPGFLRYFKNTIWLFTENILRLIAGFLVGLYVARYLGPEKFGIFSYAIAFVSIFSGIAKLGLDSIVVRDLVNYPDKRDKYLGTAFWLKFYGSFITLILIGIIIVSSNVLQITHNEFSTNLYIFLIAAGIIFQSFEVIDFYFQSKVLSKFVSICKITQLLISSLLKIFLVIIQAELIFFVLVTLFDSITLALSLSIAYKYQKVGIFFKNFDWLIGKKLLSNSWPLIISVIGITIYMRIDQIMIKEILGDRSVGLYSAAVRLSEIWYFVPIIIINSLFPAIIRAKNNNENLYYNRLRKLYTLLVWMAIGIALPITFLSNWIITYLYGIAYFEAGKVLMIHIWTSVFVFLGVAFSQYLITENLTKISMYRTIVGASINIVLNIFLLPIYGIVGAAIATLISQFASNYFFDIFNKKLHSQLKLKTLSIVWPFGIIKSSKVNLNE